MTSPPHILLVTWAGGGNVNPLVAIAKRAMARGHEVRAFGEDALARRFERAAIPFRAHRTRAEWAGREVDWPDATDADRRAWIHGLAHDVADEIARMPTDLVLVDYMMPAALCAAEASGVPTAAFVHTLYHDVAMGPYSPIDMTCGADVTNGLREELGLPPITANVDLIANADRVLAVTTPAMEGRDDAPANVRFLGPQVERDDTETTWTPPVGDRPFVTASLGTTPMGEAPILERVLEALGQLDVDGLATVGDHLAPEAFSPPANVAVSRMVPHAAVLPHARLFIGHAGLGGIQAAMTWGVPMLCLPIDRDQPGNAAAVERMGIGKALSKEATSEEIRTAVAELLEDAETLGAARALAAEVAAQPDPTDELEALLR